MASTLEKVTPESNGKEKSGGRINKASCLKSDAEFKKLFGLTKDVRVCLTRIPDLLGSGQGFDSFSNLMKSDTNKEKEFAKMKEEKKQVTDFKMSFVGIPKIDDILIFLI